MSKSTFQVQLPIEFLPFIGKINGDSMNQKVRIAFAVSLFALKEVSLARATELSGESLNDFMGILKGQGIPWGEQTEEHWRQDERVIMELLKEMDLNK